METLKTGTDTLFILLGAIMVLAMHSGFAFLELGTVRRKNQVNALVKILVDFAVSTVAAPLPPAAVPVPGPGPLVLAFAGAAILALARRRFKR